VLDKGAALVGGLRPKKNLGTTGAEARKRPAPRMGVEAIMARVAVPSVHAAGSPHHMQTSGSVRILKAFHRIQTRKVRAMLIGNKVTDSQGRPERPEWTRRGAAVAMVTDPRSV
jgi:hypothetical protein